MIALKHITLSSSRRWFSAMAVSKGFSRGAVEAVGIPLGPEEVAITLEALSNKRSEDGGMNRVGNS